MEHLLTFSQVNWSKNINNKFTDLFYIGFYYVGNQFYQLQCAGAFVGALAIWATRVFGDKILLSSPI